VPSISGSIFCCVTAIEMTAFVMKVCCRAPMMVAGPKCIACVEAFTFTKENDTPEDGASLIPIPIGTGGVFVLANDR